MIIKWKTKKKQVQILPQIQTSEVSILLSAVLLLIGSTGSTTSMFLPAVYVVLFFAILSIDAVTTVIIDALIVLFLFATTPPEVTSSHIATLFSLLLVLPLLIFVKDNYDQLKKEEKQTSIEQEEIMLFLATFLKPKMSQLEQLSQFVHSNEKNILKQIHLIQDEIDAFIDKAKTFMERK